MKAGQRRDEGTQIGFIGSALDNPPQLHALAEQRIEQYRDRKIYQIDPQTGAILRTIESNRFVTGVTWVDGELWHGAWEGGESDLRQVDPGTGEVLQRLEMPPGWVFQGSSPMAAICSSAEEGGAGR